MDFTSGIRRYKLRGIEGKKKTIHFLMNYSVKIFFFFTNFKFNFSFSIFKWCRSGICVLKTAAFEKYTALAKPLISETSEKSNLIDDRKFSNLMKSEHTINRPTLVNYEDDEEENDIEVLALL